MFNYDSLGEAVVEEVPFPYLILTDLIDKKYLKEIHEHYPDIKHCGSFPIQELKYGEMFATLVRELSSPTFRGIIEDKFHLTLERLPTMITVRGKCSSKDGLIHTDSVTKVITVLLYMNPSWEKPGGQLRLLRNRENIEDYFTEIPPEEGTMLIFKVTKNSWHGHLPFEGPRRVIQLNWLTNDFVAKKELIRHRISSRLKKIKNFMK